MQKQIVGADKIKHIGGSILLVLFLIPAFGVEYGAFAAILIGAGKEIVFDKWLKKGTPSLEDFIADIVGVFMGLMIWLVM